MFEVRQTSVFEAWVDGLKDIRAVARIEVRLRRLSLGDGVSEMRIDYGPGYRLYFTRRGDRIVILLCGGDKKRQSDDIARAKQLAKEADDGT